MAKTTAKPKLNHRVLHALAKEIQLGVWKKCDESGPACYFVCQLDPDGFVNPTKRMHDKPFTGLQVVSFLLGLQVQRN